MNCHKNNKDNKTHNSIRHMFMMALCCGLPILVVGTLPFLSFAGPRVKAILVSITPFICPIMMIFMLPMMLKGMKKEDCCSNKEENTDIMKAER